MQDEEGRESVVYQISLNLGTSIEDAARTVQRVEDAFAPILIPDTSATPETSRPNEKPEEPVLCPIASTLMQFNREIATIERRLLMLLERSQI